MKMNGLMLLTVLLLAFITGNAQNVNFSGRNVPLTTIFTTIKKQTGVVFFYDENLLKAAKPVTVSLQDRPLEAALNEIFKDQPFTWALEDKTVTITRKPATSDSSEEKALNHSLPISVKGYTIDASGSPVGDVSITVRGKKQGTVSDKSGKFSISTNPADILVFSSVSYITKEVKVERNEMNIELELDIKPMEEFIVGGNLRATKRKADATSVTVINSKTLERLPQNTIDNIYRGLVPGTNSFDVGDAPEGLLSLSIRGAAGSSSVAKVAVYIDGIEYAGGSGYLSQLDKTNIDRIEIVRGPGASTMYGTGSNAGIVQIFTKKGKPAQTEISFTTSAGFYKSKWVEENPFQQVHNLELSTGFKKAVVMVGGSYRTVGAYLPEGGESNKDIYLNAGFNLGKLQANFIGRYNVRNFSESRNPFFDTSVHPRRDILIEPSPGDTIPAFEYFRVRPSNSNHANGLTETQIAGVNLSHQTTKNWVNKLEAGYTSNDVSELPIIDGTQLRNVYQTIKNNTTTIRYSNTLNFGNSQSNLRATLLSGLEYKKYAFTNNFVSLRTGRVFKGGEPDNENYGAFAQLSPSYKKVYLTLGLRYEKNELFKPAWDPRVGLTTNFEIRSLILKPRISWGKGITAPSYTERFGIPANGLTVLYPNPNMKPQSQQGFDYGLEVYDKKGRLKFEVVYYDNILKDMIDQIALGPDPNDPNLSGFISVNGAQIVNRGWEFSGEYKTKHFILQATYSLINSAVEDTSGSYLIGLLHGSIPGSRLSNLPHHIAGLNFTYAFLKLFGKNDLGSVAVNITEVDGVKYDDYKTYFLDIAYGRAPYSNVWTPYHIVTSPVFRVGFYADYQVVSNLRIFAQGYNILNDYHYENSNSYPTHGATWLFGIKYNFVKKNQN